MGTASEWMSAAFGAILGGAGMFALREVGERVSTKVSFMYFLRLTLASVCFGLFLGFRWRAFHWPHVLFTGVFIMGLVVSKFVGRRVRPLTPG
jgi:drug/metabolite transporter (DMT)-like permease